MSETVTIDAAQVLAEFFRQRAQTPENTKIAFDVLKLILSKEGYIPSDVTEALLPINNRLDSLISSQQSITTKIGELMAKFDDVKAGIEANTAQAQKAQAEIRAKLDELLASQADVDAAVAAALAADAAADEAADAEAKANLQAAVDAQKAAIQALDDVVPDAPPTPEEPTEEPVNP